MPDQSPHECNDPQLGALLISYALGTLNDAAAEKFEQHLLHCSSCQQELSEATPILETLAASREQLVQRAHEEQEDFESQYNRLIHIKEAAAEHAASGKPRRWMESIWTVVWGRRWIIGTAGAIAFAALFALRQPSEYIPSTPKVETPSAVAPPAAMQLRAVPDSSLASQDYEVKRKAVSPQEIMSAPARPDVASKMAIPRPLADQLAVPMPEEPVIAAESHVDQTIPATEEMVAVPGEADQPMATSVLIPEAELLQAAADTTSAGDFGRMADVALGNFDPYQYQFADQSTRGGRSAEASEFRAYGVEKSAGKTRRDAGAIADSLFADRRYDEAQIYYEREFTADSTDTRSRIMVGVTLFAKGQPERARTFLIPAYELLPQGTAKDDVGLLIARSDLLAGRLDDARNRLEQITQSASDPSRKTIALRAIGRLDSLRNRRPPPQMPE